MREYATALLNHAPGKLLAVNMHLGQQLSLISNEIRLALIEKAATLYSTVERENSAQGLPTLPRDAYSALFSILQSNGEAFFLDECVCDPELIQDDNALNVLRLDGLLSRYVSDAHLIDVFSALDAQFPDPDGPPEDVEDVEDDELARKICSFVVDIYSASGDALGNDSNKIIEGIQDKLTKALHEHRPTFRTAVPFFWVGFDEPGRAGMAADELRDALGICWDRGTVLVEIQFVTRHSDTTDALYFRPTAVNSISSQDGKGGRFMACASAEWPVGAHRNWHGTTAHLGKFETAPNEPLDSFRELVRKPMPLDQNHLRKVRIIGVVTTGRASDDAATLAFADYLTRQFNLGTVPDLSK